MRLPTAEKVTIKAKERAPITGQAIWYPNWITNDENSKGAQKVPVRAIAWIQFTDNVVYSCRLPLFPEDTLSLAAFDSIVNKPPPAKPTNNGEITAARNV